MILSKSKNNLDVLRLFASLTVLFGHSYSLLNRDAPVFLGMLIHSVAVRVFFVMSGLLVFNSFRRDPCVGSFFVKRILRLLPGLIVLLLITVFAIGPFLTALTWYQYFSHPGTWRYLANVTLKIVQHLPGVFNSNPSSSVNISLWTLPIEMLMYACVPLLYHATNRVKHKKIFLFSLVAALWGLNFYFVPSRPCFTISVANIYLRDLVALSAYFLVGVFFEVNSDFIKLDRRLGLLLLLFLFWGVSLPLGYRDIVLCIIVSYLVFIFAFCCPLLFSSLVKKGDFSYGVYLYGYPVQQIIIHFIPDILPYQLFWLSLPVTFLFAVFSWFLVEKKTLYWSHYFKNKKSLNSTIHFLNQHKNHKKQVLR